MNTEKPINRVLIIVNPAAGQPEPILYTLNRVFADTPVDWQIAITKVGGDAAEAALRAVEANVDAVAIYGGDGSVTEVANALHGTSMPLAILPGGTANLLSVELGIPQDLAGAASLLTDSSARIRSVDMGRVDDQLFFHLSVGILGNLINRTDRAAKDQNGLLAYVFSGLRELQRLPSPIPFTLTLDGEEVEIESIGCMVTNYGQIGIAGLQLSHAIDLSDGLMDVMAIKDINLTTVFKGLTGAIASGEVVNALWHWRAKHISITMPTGTCMTFDGEPFESDAETLFVQVVPGAVDVIVPG